MNARTICACGYASSQDESRQLRKSNKSARRVAIGGFEVLSAWLFTVYTLTYETDQGWDTMEPVTYLVSFSTLMGGYLWFLYHNRDISYKSALEFATSARQKDLYELYKVDLQLWKSLINEASSLRQEIKPIAAEYDAKWDDLCGAQFLADGWFCWCLGVYYSECQIQIITDVVSAGI